MKTIHLKRLHLAFGFLLVLAAPISHGNTVGFQGINVSIPTSKNFSEATGMKPLEKTLKIRACIYDPIGASGPISQYAKDIVLEAKRWNVDLTIRSFTDERVAADEFKAGICDAVAVTTLRAKQFNNFVGSFDAVGNFSNYDQMKTALRLVHSNPQITPLLINGDYQVGGLIPLGAVYIMVRDRKIDSIEKAAGKKVAVMEWDRMQAKMVQQ
ncbi:MAG: putative solute-binding protein, partial [Moraxellaceae bacterium]|nr:putative solute-binding protein [Moraxellaceae bacterium]